MLPDEAAAVAEAINYAEINMPNRGTVLALSGIAIGNWDVGTGSFVEAGTPLNAVRVRTRRAEDNGNALGLFFAAILGFDQVDVSAAATAVSPSGAGTGSRFLIDDEMIDSDVPVIEKLANSIGMDKEDIISDLDGDWFIDLWKHCGSVNCQFELPTGQVGDEALFDMSQASFPYTTTSNPSFEDFLNYNEDSSSWRYNLLNTSDLDPLSGVSTVSDGSLYPNYVDPDFVHVSPVYKSDVSNLGSPSKDWDGVGFGPNQVNAKGWRRGLIAFKIIGVGADPDGAGSVLPNLIIEVISPAGIDLSSLNGGSVSGSGFGDMAQLVE